MTEHEIPGGSERPAEAGVQQTDGVGQDGLWGTPVLEAAHASTIRRMIAEAPPFRPEATRERWEVSGPRFAGWEVFHFNASPAD